MAEDNTPCNLDAIGRFCTDHYKEFKIWSEAAIPYLLAIFWHLRRHDARASVDFILRDLIDVLVRRNHPDSVTALANSYYDLPDILPHLLSLAEEPIAETFRGRSFMLESLIHLFARRNWKQ